jgi:hypothetical protein
MSFIQPINKINSNPLLYGQKAIWLKILQENNIKTPKTAIISHELFLNLIATQFPFLSESMLDSQKLIQKLPEIQNFIKTVNFNDSIWKEIYREFDKLGSPRFAFKTSLNQPYLDPLFPSFQNNRLERASENIRDIYLRLFSPEIMTQVLASKKSIISSILVQGMVYGSIAGEISFAENKTTIEVHKTADKLITNQYILDINGNPLNTPKNDRESLDYLLYPDFISVSEIAQLYSIFAKTKNLLGFYTKLVWLKNDDFVVVDLSV